MRNIFDQYDGPENRLTHALGCCLQHDRRLLRAFVRWTTGRSKPARGQLEVLEQQVPGSPIGPSDQEGSGLPDLWILGDDDWSLIVESKVQARILAGQLHRHRCTARRNGFSDIDLLVLAPQTPSHRVPGVIYRTWPDLYAWVRQRTAESEWAACMADYMEAAEARMIADGYLGDQTITRFDGIPFGPDHPYTYREGKRVLRLAMDELQKRRDLCELGVDPTGPRRTAITGSGANAVWDFLPFLASQAARNSKSFPHLTLAVQAHRALAIVSLPNAVPGRMRRNLTDLGNEEFGTLVGKVEAGITKAIGKIAGAAPFMEAVQKRYLSQRSTPIDDARLEFDLRTAASSPQAPVKVQSQWLDATFETLCQKRCHLQVGIGASFPYGDPRIRSRDVLEVFAEVWIACRPWIRTILER